MWRKQRRDADAPAEIDSTCRVRIHGARMKKPGPRAAGRAASECDVCFREGNGTCVHRFGMPGGVPFCVARCRVCICHSLSQVELLGRNLISVFLHVNNLERIFLPLVVRRQRSATCAGRARRCPTRASMPDARCDAEEKHRKSPCFIRHRASRRSRRSWSARRALQAERMPNERRSRCVRRAKKSPGLRVAQARLRGFARTPIATGAWPRGGPDTASRRSIDLDAHVVGAANRARRPMPARATCPIGRSERRRASRSKKRRRPRTSAAFRRSNLNSTVSGRLPAARRSRQVRGAR